MISRAVLLKSGKCAFQNVTVNLCPIEGNEKKGEEEYEERGHNPGKNTQNGGNLLLTLLLWWNTLL